MFKPTSAFILFLRLMTFMLIILSISRLLFLFINHTYFSHVGLTIFLQGIRFDFLAVCFGLFPVYFLIFDGLFDIKKGLKFIRYVFIIVASLFSAANCIDIIYYKFTLKRTTWDIFSYISTGDDIVSLIPGFLMDYWYISLLWILITIFSVWGVNIIINKYKSGEKPLFTRIFYGTLMSVIVILGLRGGIQLKPLNIIDASRYTQGRNIPLMLNTPFTLMKTIGKEKLNKMAYFETESEAEKYFNPKFTLLPVSLSEKKNVVIIIMESLSKEYIGFFNKDRGYTPFLDSLMAFSTVFNNAYANGKRSIEALPAIFSALPNLMNEAYNTSVYAGNKIQSIASILKDHGYNSSFFHGGKNGTMGFNSYIKMAGFDAYYGLDEYPSKDEDFDGSWGIYDRPYFSYYAGMLNKMQEPFFSSVFSLSAHHPYKLPENYKQPCNNTFLPIHQMICYSDDALRNYFKLVSKMDWYNRTIFLITADHTAQSTIEAYGTGLGIFSIPIIVFEPSNPKEAVISNTAQQADISPTILCRLNLKAQVIFFGSNAMDSTSEGFAINYLGGLYQFTDGKFCLHYDGKNLVAAYKYKSDPLLQNNLAISATDDLTPSLNKMKAIIQIYNRRMIENDLTVHD